MHAFGEFVFLSHNSCAAYIGSCKEKIDIDYCYIEKNYINSLLFLSGIIVFLTRIHIVS